MPQHEQTEQQYKKELAELEARQIAIQRDATANEERFANARRIRLLKIWLDLNRIKSVSINRARGIKHER